MTASLMGRWQTRIFTVFTVGLLWTAVITPFLPSGKTPVGQSRIGDLYDVTLWALLWTAAFGVVLWEPVWHFFQQFRWEKDWPAMFVLLQAIPEGALVHLALVHLEPQLAVTWPAFLIDFGTVWLVIFVFVHGPMRVPFIRWRFRGGRIF
ncbi:MAG: hypothetical protein ACRDYC_06440 [Acidimicrobiales bacterium]